MARFLLKPGRSYDQAVGEFEPYEKTKEVNEPAHAAGKGLITKARELKVARPSFIYINDRLERNAPITIEGVSSVGI